MGVIGGVYGNYMGVIKGLCGDYMGTRWGCMMIRSDYMEIIWDYLGIIWRLFGDYVGVCGVMCRLRRARNIMIFQTSVNFIHL